MSGRSTILLIAAALAVSTAEARGAFLPPDFSQPWEQEPASSAARAPDRPADSPDSPLQLLNLDWTAAVLHGTTGGAGSGPAPSVSVDFVALATPITASTGRQIGDYRLRESGCRLPVPFLSGIFRPPRSGMGIEEIF